jgi:hypothetical protein
MTVTGTLDVRQEVAEIGPMLWKLAALRSLLFETERYILAGTLRDVADELDHGDRPQRLVLITPNGPDGRARVVIGFNSTRRGPRAWRKPATIQTCDGHLGRWRHSRSHNTN